MNDKRMTFVYTKTKPRVKRGSVVMLFSCPFAGITQIRFGGYFLRSITFETTPLSLNKSIVVTNKYVNTVPEISLL